MASEDASKSGVPWYLGVLFWISILGMIASVVCGFVFARPAETGLGILASFLGMTFARLDSFTRIKAGSLELQMREAEKVIQVANATVDQLRGVACILAKASLDMAAAETFWNGMSWKDKLALRDSLRAELKRLGVETGRLRAGESAFDEAVRRCLVLKISDGLARYGAKPEAKGKVDATVHLSASLSHMNQPGAVPLAAQVRILMEQSKIDPEAVAEELLDLEHYEKTGTLRREGVLDGTSKEL